VTSPAIDILLVEDNPAEARLLAEMLKDTVGGEQQCAISFAERLDTALGLLAEKTYDALLLDLSLPDSQGVSTVERVQERFPLIPIVVLTGNRDEAVVYETLKRGAQDYLVKGQADAETIRRAVRYAMERKRSEADLAKTMQFLGTILDTTHMLVAYLDTGFNFVRVNKPFADENKTTVTFFHRKNYFDLFPDEALEKTLRETVRTGKPRYDYGTMFDFKKTGEPSYWDWSLVPTKDPAGQVNGLVLTLLDVTSRKLADEQLKKASETLEKEVLARTAQLRGTNERLRREIGERVKAETALTKRQQVLESIYAIETTFSASLENTYDEVAVTVAHIIGVPYAVVAQIEKGKFKAISQLTGKLFTHDATLPLSRHPCGICHRERKICRFSGDLETVFPEQMRGLAAGFKSYLGVPILNNKGVVLGMICLMDTREREYEESELHLIEIFARYIGHEIERETMAEQLRTSQKDNLLGQLASGVAHEVRNPLNGILSISEALFEEIGDNPEYTPYLTHIRTQVNRLSALMKDLLDLGKPLQTSEFTPQPLEKLLASIIDAFRYSSRHKNREIVLIPPPSGLSFFVKGDPVKLQQVFFNLLENACDHSAANKPVTVEITEPEEAHISVKVIDRGKGVEPALLNRIFQPFFTTRKGGTGLGLSIVKHIVEMHDGAITISNNTPQPGLTVDVMFPLYQE
jgi:signal transduction histidine kinase/CheY-like chemotaxis protein